MYVSDNFPAKRSVAALITATFLDDIRKLDSVVG
jgi:hypothetical protein